MGRRLAYPDVPHSRIHEIHARSQRQPIHAFGFFVDPVQFYYKRRTHLDFSGAYAEENAGGLLLDVRLELIAVGLHKLAIASIPMPRECRTIRSGDTAWLVILGTGFDNMPHVDIPEDLEPRVRVTLETEEQPTWWSMRGFTYPYPTLWIRDRAKLSQAAKE